ncbi:MAG: helix-turn-helix domain-containing protein [Gammaproteobacteria bacterium]
MVDLTSNDDPRPDGDAIGTMLRRARERRGLSINDLSGVIKLEPRTLDALEQEAWDRLPPPAFVRGYLRAIAKELGLDAGALLAIFDAAGPGEAPELSDFKSRAPLQITSESHLVRYTTLGLVMLMIVLVALWWRSHRDAGLALEELVEDVPPAAVEPATDPLPYEFELITHPDVTRYSQAPEAQTPDVDTAAAAADDEAPTGTAGETTADVAADATASAADPAAAADEATAPAADTAADIVITARADAWIDVKDASGRRLYFDFARPGRTIRLRGEAPYALVVGNADAVRLEFRGTAIDLDPHAHEGVARLELGR